MAKTIKEFNVILDRMKNKTFMEYQIMDDVDTDLFKRVRQEILGYDLDDSVVTLNTVYASCYGLMAVNEQISNWNVQFNKNDDLLLWEDNMEGQNPIKEITNNSDFRAGVCGRFVGTGAPDGALDHSIPNISLPSSAEVLITYRAYSTLYGFGLATLELVNQSTNDVVYSFDLSGGEILIGELVII